jgi:hypothetical protein
MGHSYFYFNERGFFYGLIYFYFLTEVCKFFCELGGFFLKGIKYRNKDLFEE